MIITSPKDASQGRLLPLPLFSYLMVKDRPLWEHNPSTSLLASATRVAEARARGAKLIVVDPRRIGLAVKADCWLPVRPGTDAAVALAAAGVMIEAGWFDAAFVRD